MEVTSRFDEKMERAVVRRYRAGDTQEGIARAYGTSQSVISGILQRCGARDPKRGNGRYQFQDEMGTAISRQTRQQVCADFEAGWPYVSIAAKYHIGVETVRRIARMAGLTRRNQSTAIRVKALAGYYPPVPKRTAQPTDRRETVCCLWCGALVRRRRSIVDAAAIHLCSNEHRSLLFRHTTEHGIEAPRPLIVARLVEACATCKDERRLRRAAEECCATEAEIDTAMKESKWK